MNKLKRKKQTFDYASGYYKLDKNYYSPTVLIRIEKVKKLIGNNKKVLDVGCYDGLIGKIVSEGGNEVFGLDASSCAVKLARKRGVKAIAADLEKRFPFKDETFDLVFAGEILEHILDTDFFIEEIKRVLKPGGELVLTTPNAASLGRRILLFFGKNPYFEASYGFPKNVTAGHIRFYTKDLLKSFLEFKGFEIISFESDVVNFTNTLFSKFLADIFPTIGRGLIFKCRK